MLEGFTDVSCLDDRPWILSKLGQLKEIGDQAAKGLKGSAQSFNFDCYSHSWIK